MAALPLSCLPSLSSSLSKPSISSVPSQSSHLNRCSTRLHVFSAHSTSFTTPTDDVATAQSPTLTSESFDWFCQWYPLALVSDLDKRAPRALKVLGLDIVVWWDQVEGEWKVFEDKCPHRLAPLSEGRIDAKGRLQCVYHGWCFDGAGACKFIPQAPALGPPVQKSKKACVAVYPSIEQNKLLWFWPNASPQYKDIMHKTKPPYFPELDDPSYALTTFSRDILYGYDTLLDNLMDPSHIPYAHYNILDLRKREDPETDREGGSPLELKIEKSDITGYAAKQDAGYYQFIAPCIFHFSVIKNFSENSDKASGNEQKSINVLVSVPVSPGKSRIITITARNFATWIDKFVPRWYYHIGNNLLLDSDLYILHLEERRLESESSDWHKACYVPTQADAMVNAFRTWLRKYSNGQINWGTRDFAQLPPSPPKEEIMDRYWSHVVHCKNCSGALRALKGIEIALQAVSIALIAILAARADSPTSNITKASIIAVSAMCFVASHYLSQFIRKTFYFHDYNHVNHRKGHTLLGRLLGGL